MSDSWGMAFSPNGVLPEAYWHESNNCARCGRNFLEPNGTGIQHTLGLQEPGKVLSFCSNCIGHILKCVQPLGTIEVVEATAIPKQCSHCDRIVPLDDQVPLDDLDEILCVGCDDKLKEELDDFTNPPH